VDFVGKEVRREVRGGVRGGVRECGRGEVGEERWVILHIFASSPYF
jgi:hypothetical protein